MDTDLYLRIAKRFDMVFVHQIWSRFRDHTGQKTAHKTPEGMSERIYILDKFYSDMDTVPVEAVKVRRAAYAWAYWCRGYRCFLIGNDWYGGFTDFIRAFKYDPFIFLRKDVLVKNLKMILSLSGIEDVAKRMRSH
jgi:hypothetical protein